MSYDPPTFLDTDRKCTRSSSSHLSSNTLAITGVGVEVGFVSGVKILTIYVNKQRVEVRGIKSESTVRGDS